MYFALLIRSDDDEMATHPPETFTEIKTRVDAFDARITKEGRIAGSVRLSEDGVRVVRLRGGKPFVTDGPFAESKEQLGGIYLLTAADLDEATSLAADLVMAFGSIEIRPVIGLDLRDRLLFPADM